MKNLLFISSLFLGSLSIIAQKDGRKNIKMSGKIAEAQGKTIFINSFKNNKMVPLDSATINKKGKFKLQFSVPADKAFYSLSFTPKNYALLILDSASTSSKITFNSPSTTITKDYEITGSKESEDILKFTTIVNNFQGELNQLKAAYEHPDSAKIGQLKQQELYQGFTQKRNAFVTQHSNSLALLITTAYFNPQTELDWYKKIEKSLAASVPNSNYHLSIKAQIQQIEAAKKANNKPQRIQQDPNIGQQFSELNFPNPEGEIMTMEALKGNYVLVDFWASWCKPCRMENPNVVKLYNKYKDKGFTVYSVSLDTDKNRWKNAIQQDQLTWPNHVSDLKGWRTQATKTYQFRGIPYTMLVDPKGTIIATKLRGHQLEQQLEAIFGD
ncbi:MAG: AhpC/TSA family protein [Flavobacteriales bacterium]|jgi:thiol-disulfide isomerase/thioredoxin|nr:AhpC/TSA family protein [Flavobacteriales bacterium]